MVEYFNGVLQRLSCAMQAAIIVCIIGWLISGVMYLSLSDDKDYANTIKAKKACKAFLIAITIEISAIIWLPTHL